MVRTRSVYKATGEQLSVLDIFRKPPTRKTKSTSTMSTDEQIAMPSDLAAKVVVLSNDIKTVLDWIKTQSAAPSTMSVEKSGRLAGTPPPNSHVTPMKDAAEDTSGARNDDNSDDDGSIAPSVAEGRSQPFKVEAKIEIPNYDGIVDLYNYSNSEKITFVKLKLEFYPMGYEEERWKRWYVCAKSVTRQCRTTPPTSGAKPWRLASPSMIHSQKNLISENLVQRLGLSTTPHPHPYPLGWINSKIEMKIDRECKVKFPVTGVYIDEMLCEVVSLNICNLIFGSPYLGP
uniref:Uncharacterized protein n=1 Tax=Ananas comosus var. bracteatus TaxID=296719 RepID=A0A6V7QNE4_ANACO|nr:unnamed protein product [Ananas comosus var. bracteatus]